MLGLSVIYLIIFEIVWVDFWMKSCCWPICAFLCHALHPFVYEMIIMHDLNVGPIVITSQMFDFGFGWLFLAALTFSFIFDPRLALVVLWTYVEFICFRLSIVLPRSYQFDWCLFVYIVLTFCFVGDSCNLSLALHSWPSVVDCLFISFCFELLTCLLISLTFSGTL